MTRENKLALVVGFGLVLFVGILVSDHYSAINRKPGADLHDPSAMARAEPVRTIRDITNRPATPPIAAGAPQLASSGGGADGGDGSAAPGGSTLPDGSKGVHVPTGTIEPRLDEVFAKRGPDLAPGDGGTIVDPLRAAPTYVVKKGDTLYGIARDQLASGERWKEIQDLNKLKDAKSLAEGMRLTMPAMSTDSGKALLVDARTSGDRMSETTKPEATRPVSTKLREHTVRDGETLTEIARKMLGTGNRWQELYQLNKDRLTSPDTVAPGTVLRIPDTKGAPANDKPRGAARA